MLTKHNKVGKSTEYDSKKPDAAGMRQIEVNAALMCCDLRLVLVYLDAEIEKLAEMLRRLQPNEDGKVGVRWWTHRTWPGRHPVPFRWKVSSAVVNYEQRVVASCTPLPEKMLALRAKKTGSFEHTSCEVKLVLERLSDLLALRRNALEIFKSLKYKTKGLVQRVRANANAHENFNKNRVAMVEAGLQRRRNAILAQERRRDAALAQRRDSEDGWDVWFELQGQVATRLDE